jgi:protein-tyrosine phosphatase
MKSKSLFLSFVLLQMLLSFGRQCPVRAATTMPTAEPVGERVPSEDPVLHDFHSLGLVDGHVDIFRCASPVRELGASGATTQTSDEQMNIAKSRMSRLFGLGIRTIVCLERPQTSEAGSDAAGQAKIEQLKSRLALENAAAEENGIKFISFPMDNSGLHSLEDMSDVEVLNWLESVREEILKDAKTGGVVFHCSAGHDRTGIVAAYIRIKDEHWPVEQAIEEMRRYGHNWVKYSKNGGISSWHEDHLRAIAKMLAAQTADAESK